MERKANVVTTRAMEHINNSVIREFVLNSILSNIVMSKSHGHGLLPIVNKVKDIRFNGNIICKKSWYKIHKIPQRTFYNY
jgi:hypothetical protein